MYPVALDDESADLQLGEYGLVAPAFPAGRHATMGRSALGHHASRPSSTL